MKAFLALIAVCAAMLVGIEVLIVRLLIDNGWTFD